MNQNHFSKLIYVCLFSLIYSCAGSQSLTGTKSSKAYALFGEALQDYDVREYDDALSKLNKALKKDPRYIEAYDLKGKIKQEQGDLETAKTVYQKILEIDPTYKYAHFELAEIYFDEGEYAQCENHLKGLSQVSMRDKVFYKQIQLLKRNTAFAKNAVKNPVPFKPINLGKEVNSAYEDYFPGLTLDESQLFFTRRDASVSLRMQNEDLYISKKDNDQWSLAVSLGPPVNTRENEGAFTTTIDGKYILFTACNRIRGGRGSCDIWYTYQIGDEWQKPGNMGGPINTAAWESQPSMSSDGKTLYFASNRKGGFGGTDIWRSSLGDKGWSDPINLGPKINTSEDEQFPFIHPDGKTMYFTSNGHAGMGQSDIYYCKFENNQWGLPINIGYPINTAGEEWNFIVNRTGTKAYFSSNGIAESFGGMDIYTFDLYEAARPNTVSYVKGLVFDAKTKLPLKAKVELIDLKTGKLVLSSMSDPKTGSFLTALASNSNYALHVRVDGYLFHSENFELQTSSLEKPFELDIPLYRIEIGKQIALRNIFFDTDKAVLLPESKTELATLIAFLQKNPNINIKINGHTDDVGDNDHNLDLSKRRAKSVYQYLIEQGISDQRIGHEGYGELKPISTNDTPEGRAKNRRTEFEIVK
jgi:outer membrane protein OmpA-like peptidoglycan-associated protein/tetratricopeptide (TPR) repeat protein